MTQGAHGYHPEFGELPEYSAQLSVSEQEILDKVFLRYSKKFNDVQLHDLITQKGTPWYNYRGRFDEVIPNKVIANYYSEMISSN